MINFTYSENPPEKDGEYLVIMSYMFPGGFSKPYYNVLSFREGHWNIKEIIQVYAWFELPDIKISPTP